MLSNTMMLGGGRKAAYSIENSLLFQGTQYLSWKSAAGNRRTWTFSAWVRPTSVPAYVFAAGGASGGQGGISILADGRVEVREFAVETNSETFSCITRAVLRDPAAWYHLAVVYDTTQATNTDRVVIFVNGVRQELSVANYPAPNFDAYNIGNTGKTFYIGKANVVNNSPFNTYIAEAVFVDGAALVPSVFGEADPYTSSWRPKALTDIVFGSNGFSVGNPFEATRPGIDHSHGLAAAEGENNSVLLSAATGSGPIFDWSPADVPVTNSGIQYATNKVKFGNSSYYCNGSSLLTVPADVDFGAGDFTIEMWVNADSYAPANYAREFCGTRVYSAYQANGFSVRVDNSNSGSMATNGQFLFDIALGDTVWHVTSSGLTNGQWTHVCFMRKGDMLFGFRNGVQMSSSVVSGGHVPSDKPVKVGDGYDTASNISGFVGAFDQFRISKRACYSPDGFVVPGTFTPGNHFATSSLAAMEVVKDTPTNVYPVLSPINKSAAATVSDGLLRATGAGTAADLMATAFVGSGAWYCEFAIEAVDSNTDNPNLGIQGEGFRTSPMVLAGRTGWLKIDGATSQNTNRSYQVGDIVHLAFRPQDKTFWAGKNGVWFDAGDPAAGTNPLAVWGTDGRVAPYVRVNGSAEVLANFGQRPFTYSPPAGFLPLCTANLPATTGVTSGSFTGNANADGQCVYTGAVPETLTINGNAVTWGTHADKLATGFKIRTASTSYNGTGNNTWTATYDRKPTVGPKGRAPANAQGN